MATRSRKGGKRYIAVTPRTEHHQALQPTARAVESYRARTTSTGTKADENATSRIGGTASNRGWPRKEAPVELLADSTVVLNHDAAAILARIIRAHLSRSGRAPSSASSERRETGRTTRN
jgi:hypothetical protein